MKSLLDGVRDASKLHGERPAIVDVDGSVVTYARLSSDARAIGGWLRAAGLPRGARVAVHSSKRARAVAAFLGTLEARCAYVPIDASTPLARRIAILEDCEVTALFTTAAALAHLRAERPDLVPDVVVILDDDASWGEATSWVEAISSTRGAVDEAPSTSADDLAYILYTSGSTGSPKGVAITHGNATSFVDWCANTFDITSADRLSNHASLQFDLSVFDVFVAFRQGATVCLVPEAVGSNPKLLGAFIQERAITVWYSTPSALMLLVEHARIEQMPTPPRLVFFAGEPFPIRHLRRLTEAWPGARYHNMYGPTETNVCTFARIELPIPASRVEPYPIGRACAHCRTRVVDEHGNDVPRGEEGILCIAGASVFAGYFRRPEPTAQAFFEVEGERWYKTGDVVRETPSDGYVFLGRRDRMVKRRGYRIELDDIESGLYVHGSVDEAAVVAVTDPERGGTRIVAFIVKRDAGTTTTIEMKQHCTRVLPLYMIPDAFRFVERIPRTVTQKIDYRALELEAVSAETHGRS